MAYEPTVWKTGDKVTASKLNRLENAVGGLSGAAVFLHVWEDTVATAMFEKAWYTSEDSKFHTYSRGTLPGLGVVVKTGILAAPGTAFDPETMTLDYETASAHASDPDKWFVKESTTAVGKNDTAYYTWNKSSVTAGDVWYLRAFMDYTDADGAEHMVYGDLLRAEAGVDYENPDYNPNLDELETTVTDPEMSAAEIFETSTAGTAVFLIVWERQDTPRDRYSVIPLHKAKVNNSGTAYAEFDRLTLDPDLGLVRVKRYYVTGTHAAAEFIKITVPASDPESGV